MVYFVLCSLFKKRTNLDFAKLRLVLASLCCITMFCALTFKPLLPSENWHKPIEKLKKSFGIEILKNYKFLNWSVSCFLGIGGSMIPLLTMVS